MNAFDAFRARRDEIRRERIVFDRADDPLTFDDLARAIGWHGTNDEAHREWLAGEYGRRFGFRGADLAARNREMFAATPLAEQTALAVSK